MTAPAVPAVQVDVGAFAITHATILERVLADPHHIFTDEAKAHFAAFPDSLNCITIRRALRYLFVDPNDPKAFDWNDHPTCFEAGDTCCMLNVKWSYVSTVDDYTMSHFLHLKCVATYTSASFPCTDMEHDIRDKASYNFI